MTVKQRLEELVNARIAKELWDKLNTELEAKSMSGELADEHVRFSWMTKRSKELLKEYLNEKETKN